jgi:hypothetical protein
MPQVRSGRRTLASSKRVCRRPGTGAPVGDDWLHEVKHDGFRMLIRRDRGGVRLFTRGGRDGADHFPAIATAAAQLSARSFTIDGKLDCCRKAEGSRFVSTRSADWRKTKNPACAAVTRGAEEEWGERSGRGHRDGRTSARYPA